jgi:phage terminase small subunit
MLESNLEKTSETSDFSTEAELSHTEFQSFMPYMGLNINDLTVQQEKLVQLVASGMSVAAAGRAAGYATPNAAREAARRPAAAKALEFLREEMRETVNFKRENAHMMYMEAYTSSANATEMKNTVDSLVKLHGLATPDNSTQININVQGTKQLERMSDAELLKLAGQNTNYLEPSSGG